MPPSRSEPNPAHGSRPRQLTDAAIVREIGVVAPAIYGWATMRIPPNLRARLDPEDLLQEVLCRMMLSSSGFDPALGSFRSWAFGFARRVLHEALRRCAREGAAGPRLSLTDAAQLPAEATSLTRRIAKDEMLRIFSARVGELDDGDRRLLLLRGLEGLDHLAIARELGVSSTAVAKRWQRLRERLGTELDALLSA
ncbi:MAG: sigma-70 family RNA polymerase sigma factor [Planctomycetes bacterium]|nr:sigma-70 family RNA polymerase sigma factor [Planctomycetota bacterium]